MGAKNWDPSIVFVSFEAEKGSEAELSEEEAEVVALVGLGGRVVVPTSSMQVNNYI